MWLVMLARDWEICDARAREMLRERVPVQPIERVGECVKMCQNYQWGGRHEGPMAPSEIPVFYVVFI
jgi:hypothetical protein